MQFINYNSLVSIVEKINLRTSSKVRYNNSDYIIRYIETPKLAYSLTLLPDKKFFIFIQRDLTKEQKRKFILREILYTDLVYNQGLDKETANVQSYHYEKRYADISELLG